MCSFLPEVCSWGGVLRQGLDALGILGRRKQSLRLLPVCQTPLKVRGPAGQTHLVRLLGAKARVTPTSSSQGRLKDSTPRVEMRGLLMLARLIDTLLPGIQVPPAEVMLIGDSQCTIACVEADNRVLDVWFSNRVAEVQDRMESWRRKDMKVNDLYHWPGVSNVADLATKGRAVYCDVKEGSVWQQGPRETQYPVEEWPISRDFVRAIPEEEKRAAIFGVHMSLMPSEVTMPPAVVGREDDPLQSLSCCGIQGHVNQPQPRRSLPRSRSATASQPTPRTWRGCVSSPSMSLTKKRCLIPQ